MCTSEHHRISRLDVFGRNILSFYRFCTDFLVPFREVWEGDPTQAWLKEQITVNTSFSSKDLNYHQVSLQVEKSNETLRHFSTCKCFYSICFDRTTTSTSCVRNLDLPLPTASLQKLYSSYVKISLFQSARNNLEELLPLVLWRGLWRTGE